jgi:hypothetical protein
MLLATRRQYLFVLRFREFSYSYDHIITTDLTASYSQQTDGSSARRNRRRLDGCNTVELLRSRFRWKFLLIDVASMTDSDDNDEKNSVIDRVNDSVVANSEPITRPTTKGSRSRRTWILCEKCDRTLNARLYRAINFAKFAHGRWPKLDAVVGHDQPRSIFTCSQGMLFPSSLKAASNAATS